MTILLGPRQSGKTTELIKRNPDAYALVPSHAHAHHYAKQHSIVHGRLGRFPVTTAESLRGVQGPLVVDNAAHVFRHLLREITGFGADIGDMAFDTSEHDVVLLQRAATSEKPWPQWAMDAIDAGWEPPKGWKP